MQASPTGTSVIRVNNGFKQNQNVAVSLPHRVTHYLVGTAEAARYFAITSNFLRIVQLQQEVIHLGPADGTFKVKTTSLWLIQAKSDFVFRSWAQGIYPLNIKVTITLPRAILNKRNFPISSNRQLWRPFKWGLLSPVLTQTRMSTGLVLYRSCAHSQSDSQFWESSPEDSIFQHSSSGFPIFPPTFFSLSEPGGALWIDVSSKDEYSVVSYFLYPTGWGSS